jgi:hypothetical protein
MKIKVTNDGKQKAQSCEAELELDSESTYWGLFNAKFKGYGVNDYSAKMNLVQQIDDLIIQLNKIKENP